MVLELSELGVIGNGCLMVHKVGVHTVESEVKQQLAEVLLPVAEDSQRVPVPSSWDGSRGSYSTATAAALVRDCMQKTLTEWSSKISQDQNQETLEVLECTVAQAIEKINPEERDELKVSAKLFIVGSNSSSIRDAVDLACSALGVAQLDSVIIVPPPVEDGANLSLEYLQPYWKELENLVQNKKIVAIGTSDLDKTLLEQLYLWAQVKPNSNQVNLASCCVMPPDLTAFAKECDIQLLTHNDPKELLCEASFQEVLQESIQNVKANEWIPLWLLRYSVIVKSRGIIKSKGYIIQAKRNAS
ncbi:PREDICTED: glutamate--cysteine ligase regulatory subunit isoform X1 [Corvus brachyrhynchos]|nr:PREDICTED: glutamate--cysteine ligase regulatory subunit isoform X1 [Corvus brachyrhynchos]